MSAQMITALEVQAARLDGEADRMSEQPFVNGEGDGSPRALRIEWRRFLANEYRVLAATAQGLPPG